MKSTTACDDQFIAGEDLAAGDLVIRTPEGVLVKGKLYVKPPAPPAPAVPELNDKALREEMNAAVMLATDEEGITDGEIVLRGFANRVLMKWGTQEGMYLAFRDAVTAPVPKEWREVMSKLVGIVESSTKFHGCDDVTKQARALLQSTEVQAGDKWQLTPAPTHPADRNVREVRHD